MTVPGTHNGAVESLRSRHTQLWLQFCQAGFCKQEAVSLTSLWAREPNLNLYNIFHSLTLTVIVTEHLDSVIGVLRMQAFLHFKTSNGFCSMMDFIMDYI